MRAVRFLTFALLLVVGFAGTASAQYNNTPGVYTDIQIGVAPAIFPPQFVLQNGNLGPDLYIGTLTVVRNADNTYFVQYQGERKLGEDIDKNGKINITASFESDWAGWKQSFRPVGTTMEEIIDGIDGANLISANINGVGTVDQVLQRVIAKVRGTGSYPPELIQFKTVKAPGYTR